MSILDEELGEVLLDQLTPDEKKVSLPNQYLLQEARNVPSSTSR
jgi:hypothetical protein